MDQVAKIIKGSIKNKDTGVKLNDPMNFLENSNSNKN